MIPFVIEKTPNGERSYDLYSRMLKDRIVFVTGAIDENMASSVVAQLLFLESENPEAEIMMYLNSPGGSVVAGMSIFDAMNFIKCDVRTIVTGQAASMGSLLASSGTKGKRMMMKHATHMIHQPLAGYQGQASDMEIHTNETLRWKKALNDVYVENTGQAYDTIMADTNRDNFMTSEESVKYGLADEVITRRE